MVTDGHGATLPYVSIGVVHSVYGTVSDDKGNFEVGMPQVIKNDSLRFSCIGYVSKTLLLTAMKPNIEVYLDADTQVLANVVVRPMYTEMQVIGSTHTKGMTSNNFAIGKDPGQNLGAEIGERFTLRGERAFLNKLNVFINADSFDSVGFRVNIYSIKDGMPDKNLLTSNIYFAISNKAIGWTSLDLTPYGLVLDQDVIVSLQWIRHSRNGTSLSLPLSIPAFGHLHYYRYGSESEWKKYANMTVSMNMEVGIVK